MIIKFQDLTKFQQSYLFLIDVHQVNELSTCYSKTKEQDLTDSPHYIRLICHNLAIF